MCSSKASKANTVALFAIPDGGHRFSGRSHTAALLRMFAVRAMVVLALVCPTVSNASAIVNEVLFDVDEDPCGLFCFPEGASLVELHLAEFEAYNASKFDPALGTLNSVGIDVLGRFGSSARAQFVGPFLTGMSGTISLFDTLVRVSVGGFSMVEGFQDRETSCSGFPTLSAPVPFCDAQLPLQLRDFHLSTTLMEQDSLDDFIGPGPLTIIAFQEQSARFSAFALFGNVDADIDSYATSLGTFGTVRITYNYTEAQTVPAVPEPTTLTLLGIALAGLDFSRRKRAVN